MLNTRSLMWLGLAAFFTLLLLGWQKLRQQEFLNAEKTFDVLVNNANDRLINRMLDYEGVLKGARGLFLASDNINRNEWEAYYRALQLDLSLTGIQGLGYSVIFPKPELAAFEEQVRAQGYPEFSVYPDGDRSIYSAIVYIEPFSSRNLRAFGYDMYSEPIRRKAMDRAISTALPSWSGKVELVQEFDIDIQPGLLVYLPIYKKGYPTRSENERQDAIQGFVYSAFRAEDLLSQVFDYTNRQLELQLYDQQVGMDNLLYSTVEAVEDTTLNKTIEIKIGGATWIGVFTSNQQFENELDYSVANTVLVAGLFVLLVLLISLIVDERKRRKLVETSHLLESRFENSVKTAELTKLLQSCSDIEEAFPIIASVLSTMLPSLSGVCYMLNNSETLLISKRNWGDQNFFAETCAPQECWAVKRSAPHLYRYNVLAEVRCRHLTEPSETICAPLVTQGRLIGVLSFAAFSSNGRASNISKHEVELISSVSEIISLALANLILRESLRESSVRDSLTGLFNRRVMEEILNRELDRSRRIGSNIALAMLDLDHFKLINDSYGHTAGDKVLKAVSELMAGFRSGSDYVARYGGEEFLLVLTDISREEASERLEHLRQSIERLKVEAEGYVIENITLSIGVAMFPQMGEQLEELLSRSDQALYEAKRNGRNQVVFYSENASDIDF